MRRVATLACSLAMMLLGALSAQAAAPKQVEWTVGIDSVSPTEGAIVWSATIADGWHIYGMEMPEGLDVPITLTQFKTTASKGVELGDVKPEREAERHLDPVMEAEIPWWEGIRSSFLYKC